LQSASPVATALRTTTQQPIATQRSLPWRNRACCSAAQRVATRRNLLQQTTARCNLLQRLQRCAIRCNRPQPAATCCSAAQRVPQQSDATQHNLLQRTTTAARRNRFNGALVATECDTCRNAAQPGVAQPNLLQRSALHHGAICYNRPQPVATCCSPLQRSAAGCNKVPSVATDHSPLQPVAAIAMLCEPLQ
jgi:hypothetical protein